MRIDARQTLLAVAAVAVTAAGATAPAAVAKPKARAAPAVRAVAGPKAAVAPGAKVALSAKAANRSAKPARVAVTFHLSSDPRLNRTDLKLGTVSTKRLKKGAAATVKLTAKLPARAKPGSWVLLACTGPARKPACVAGARKLVVKAPTVKPPVKPPVVVPPVIPPVDPPAPKPSLAVQLDDGFQWSNGRPDAAETVETKVRLGAGLPGQAGYDRTEIAPVAGLTGTARTIVAYDDSDPGDVKKFDDYSFAVSLPFAVTLGGVATRTVNVSTNGWISTTDVAESTSIDWYEDEYRGPAAAMGANIGAIAPFWRDLIFDAPGDQIELIEAADGQSVAIRWTTRTYSGKIPVSFEAVLSPDGRIRFDYLSDGQDGESPSSSAVGISPGIAGQLAEMAIEDRGRMPAQSILFTPKAVSATPVVAGTVDVEVPRGATFVPGDGCTLAAEATLIAPGRVTCPVPALNAAGAEVSVRWAAPSAEVIGAVGDFFDQAATWTAGDATATGSTELGDRFDRASSDAALVASVTGWENGGPVATVVVRGSGDDVALRHPRLTAQVPAGVQIAAAKLGNSDPLGAGALAQICTGLPVPEQGGEVSCLLPNGYWSSSALQIAFALASPAPQIYPVPLTLTADNLSAPLSETLSIDMFP